MDNESSLLCAVLSLFSNLFTLFLSNETKLINNPKISQLKTSCLSYMLVLRNTNPLYNLLSSIIHNLPFICFNFYIK